MGPLPLRGARASGRGVGEALSWDAPRARGLRWRAAPLRRGAARGSRSAKVSWRRHRRVDFGRRTR
eukprot:3464630-Pyramimonas_sp.AAC.1